MHRFLLLSLVFSTMALGCAASPESEEQASSSDALASGGGGARVRGTYGLGLRIRAEPTTGSAIVGTLSEGQGFSIACQTTGESIEGNARWDYLDGRGFVAHRYVAGGEGAPSCNEAEEAPSSPGPGIPAPASPADFRGWIVAHARSHLGVTSRGDCNDFSKALGRPCEAWCSDFLNYVWQQAGANVDGINAWSGTFLDYGARHGTLKGRDAPDIAPGDAVVWANSPGDSVHVGMVTEVRAGGGFRAIHGNWNSSVAEVEQSRSTTIGGYGIKGFVSPVPR